MGFWPLVEAARVARAEHAGGLTLGMTVTVAGRAFYRPLDPADRDVPPPTSDGSPTAPAGRPAP